MSCDHGYTLRRRGEQGPHFFRWRFDKCVFVVFRFRRCITVALHTFHRKNVKPVSVVGHLVLGLASGLEAFSREPPCGSFGALAFRQTPETRGTAWEFLSYYPILPSRYLRDPFTISRLIRFHNTCFRRRYQVHDAGQEPKDSPCSLCANNLFLAISS